MDDDYDYRGRVYEILTEAQSAPISKEDAEWIIGVVDVLGHLYDGAMQDCDRGTRGRGGTCITFGGAVTA